MKLSAEQERLRELLTDTITLLCKNGLQYKQEFSVEALIGITLDKEDVFLVNIKEIVRSAIASQKQDEDVEEKVSQSESETDSKSGSPRKRRRKRKATRSNMDGGTEAKQSRESESDGEVDNGEDLGEEEEDLTNSSYTASGMAVKEERQHDADLVVVKHEPGTDAYGTGLLMGQAAFPGMNIAGDTGGLTSPGQAVHPGLSQGLNDSQNWSDTSMNTSQLSTSQDPSQQMIQGLKMVLVNGKKKYLCPICQAICSHRPHLKEHLNIVHGIGPQQTYTCACGRNFKWKRNRDSHARKCDVVGNQGVDDVCEGGGDLERSCEGVISN